MSSYVQCDKDSTSVFGNKDSGSDTSYRSCHAYNNVPSCTCFVTVSEGSHIYIFYLHRNTIQGKTLREWW